jgi:hypothetical protein
MKSQILKIAGVKSEKEFYKKYPSEEAFMKVHGKAFKKAQIGTLVGGATPKQTFSTPNEYLNLQGIIDKNDKLITGSTQKERDKAAAAQAAANKGGESGGGMGGMMGGIGDLLKMFGGQGAEGEGMAEGAAMAGRYGMDIPIAYSGFSTPDWFNNTTVDTTTMGVNQRFPKPPITIDNEEPDLSGLQPNLSKRQMRKQQEADQKYQIDQDQQITGADDLRQGETPSASGFTKAMEALGPLAGPITGIAQGIDALNAERRAKQNAQRDAKVAEVAMVASATREEQSKRRYVRPEDIQNTGEEFFPIYGVGTNVLTRNGGAIHRAQDGDYIGGNPTEIQNTYSNGYDIYTDGGYEPLQDPNQVKDFRHGGYLHTMQEGGETGWQRWQNSMAGKGKGFSGSTAGGSGKTPWGAIGSTATGVGQAALGGQNAGGNIGSTVGGAVGSIFGPAGGAIGSFVGGMAGNLLDTNPRDMKKAQDRTKAYTRVMSLNSGFQGLQETHNRYVRNGGDIPNYEDGGYMNPEYNPQVITMFGDVNAQDFADFAHKDEFRAGGHLKSYTPPSERAMETYAMGGQLQTHWGGGAETVSHNPYMPGSGETVLFRGQSHTDSDGKGNTGIGITYGENPVEVERGEPMFEMEAGGEINPETGKPETTGVVLGNLLMNKNVASQFNDPDLMKVADIYNGKRMKNIGVELAKQEAKQNKIISKTSDLIDSLKVETSLDKTRLAGLQAMLQGADTKLRDIANTKITLANYQNAINDAKDELSDVIGENLSAEDLSKGYVKLDKDPVTKDAKWGGNIVKKAQNGETTKPKIKSFKSEREANAAGYYKREDGKYYRKVTKYKTEDKETKSATAMDNIPKQSVDKGTGFAGGVTKEKFEEFKKRFPDYPGIDKLDPKDPISLHDFKTWANAKAQETGSKARILDDPKTKSNPQGLPIFGDQFLSFTLDQSRKTEPSKTEEEYTAVVDEPTSTPAAEKSKFPWWATLGNMAINYLRPTDQEELDGAQLYPEWYAMASNQVEPVPAQSYQPELIVPYDISLQAQRNAVNSGVRNLQRQIGYNPAAQSNAAPAAYNAINEINEKEFIANQGLKNQVYTGNVNTMNEAKKINLGIFADQWAKQSLARSNTKATTQAALNSIADKYAKNKLENRKLSIYENMYNYRFGKNGRAQNYNPLQFFDYTVGGGSSDKTGGLAAGKEFTYDASGNIVGVRNSDKNSVSSADLESAGGISLKNGGKAKKNYKNSSIVRAFKNL